MTLSNPIFKFVLNVGVIFMFIYDFEKLLRSEGFTHQINLNQTIDKNSIRVVHLMVNGKVVMEFRNWESFQDYEAWNSNERTLFLKEILKRLKPVLTKK